MTNPKAKNAAQEAPKDTSAPSAGANVVAAGSQASAPTEPQAPTAGAATDAGAGAALVLAETKAPEPDEHHGKGGLYQLVDGQRVLVQQTKAAD